MVLLMMERALLPYSDATKSWSLSSRSQTGGRGKGNCCLSIFGASLVARQCCALCLSHDFQYPLHAMTWLRGFEGGRFMQKRKEPEMRKHEDHSQVRYIATL